MVQLDCPSVRLLKYEINYFCSTQKEIFHDCFSTEVLDPWHARATTSAGGERGSLLICACVLFVGAAEQDGARWYSWIAHQLDLGATS